MIDLSQIRRKLIKRWLIGLVAISYWLWASWMSPAIALTSTTPTLDAEIVNLPLKPLKQFSEIRCSEELQRQFNQQAKIPFSCNLGEMLSPERVLAIGNFAGFGLTQTNLAQIAGINNINLSQIGADQLQNLYGLITPNKLLGDRFNNVFNSQLLGDLPLIKEALIQDITNKIQIGNLAQLQPLNDLLQQAQGYADLLNPEQLKEQISKLALDQIVGVLPSFGDFSLSNLPISVLQSFNVNDAIPGLVDQALGSIPGVESLMIGDLGAIGLPNLSLSQFPNPLSLVGGFSIGQFDIPLSNDEKDPGRHLAGGIPEGDYQLRKQKCSEKCKFAEIISPIPTYHGAAWVDGPGHWVPDGFGVVCWAWPGGCKGPAGNHPFGKYVRLLLTDINASTGTAQLAMTFPICWDVWFVGTTCTPAIFPIPTGIPIYTVKEGDWLPFVPPVNYGDKNANWSPPNSPDKPISRSIA
jgi:hypothetical protein